MAGYTVFLGPFAAIMVADYFLVKRGRLDIPELYDPHGKYRELSFASPLVTGPKMCYLRVHGRVQLARARRYALLECAFVSSSKCRFLTKGFSVPPTLPGLGKAITPSLDVSLGAQHLYSIVRISSSTRELLLTSRCDQAWLYGFFTGAAQ